MVDIGALTAQFHRLRQSNAERDRAMNDVSLVRQGKMSWVYPDLFPEEGPFADRSIVANMIDVAARDTAEVLAPMPAINCSSSTSVSDRAKSFAEKRTRIANNYVAHCKLQKQMYMAADRYVTFGFVPGMVEVDGENLLPFIRLMDPRGCYWVEDRFGRITAFYQQTFHDVDDLAAKFPALDNLIRSTAMGSNRVEVVRYHDKEVNVLFMPGNGGHQLLSAPNPMGEITVRVAKRPGLDDTPRGQYDDVLAVQVAKSRFALLALEAAQKSVQAPIVLPPDVLEMPVGPDTALRTSMGQQVRRVELNVPREAFAEQGSLDNELRQGSRYPDARNGEVEGSIVTGRGVQALMSGFDTQIRTGQAMFADLISELVGLAFKMDERLWADLERTVRGNDNGTPFEIKYKPARDINGDYSVDVQYGLMAGLDPNRALVFGLQARGDKLISREFLRRNMPFALDATEEEQKLDIEDMREALKQAVAGYAQAIPILAQNGQDPGEILARLAAIIEGRQKGKAIEDVVSAAFAPQAPPPGAEPPVEAASPVPGAPGEAPPGGGLEGIGSDGMVRGVAAGQAGMGQGGRPDLNILLAGLTQRGEPSLQVGVSRRIPV